MGEYSTADILEMVDDIENRRGDWLDSIGLLAMVAIAAIENNGGTAKVRF